MKRWFLRLQHALRGYHGDEVDIYEVGHADPDEGYHTTTTYKCHECGGEITSSTVFRDQPWR